MAEIIVTRKDVNKLVSSLNKSIRAGDKAGSVGNLFQLSMNIASFIRQNRKIVDKEIRGFYGNLLEKTQDVLRMSGALDNNDSFMLNEALELVQRSLRDERLEDLLVRLQGTMGEYGLAVEGPATPELNM